MEEVPKFNPESRFIEHSNLRKAELLEKKKFDFAYQAEFRDYIFNLFKDSNLIIPERLKSYLDLPEEDYGDYEIETIECSTYIQPTLYLNGSFSAKYPQDRSFLDEDIKNEIRKISKETSVEVLDHIITKEYLRKVDIKKFMSLMQTENDQAKKNFLMLMIQVMDPEAIKKTDNEIFVNLSESSAPSQACIVAEKHMLAYVSGRHEKPWAGYINLIVDDNRQPVMLEKMGIGDPHSCLSLKPIRLGRVLIPAGAIFTSDPHIAEPERTEYINWFTGKENKEEEKRQGAINYITTLKDYNGFSFKRMSTISVPEEIRASAGGSYYLYQQNRTNGYINYDWITPEIIAEYAELRLKQEGM